MTREERAVLHEYIQQYGWKPVEGMSRSLDWKWVLLTLKTQHGWIFHTVRVWIWGLSKQDPTLARLFARGWQVIGYTETRRWKKTPPPMTDREVGDPDPKNTDEVAPSSEMGGDLHGGSHASCEVPESPVASKDSTQQGNAAGQPCGEGGSAAGEVGAGDNENNSVEGAAPSTDDQSSPWAGDWSIPSEAVVSERDSFEPFRVFKNRGGSAPAWVPPDTRGLSADEKAAAEKTARLLAELVGNIAQRNRLGLDAVELTWRVRTGIDPSPALWRPQLTHRASVLITPDVSGSCQAWSPIWVGIAKFLHKQLGSEIELLFVENVNGEFIDQRGKPLQPALVDQLLERCSVVFYAGDVHGIELTEQYARAGAVVIAFDNYCASAAAPTIDRELSGHIGAGQRVWVNRISASVPDTWVRAAEIAVQYAL